jgi:hypothetical protein
MKTLLISIIILPICLTSAAATQMRCEFNEQRIAWSLNEKTSAFLELKERVQVGAIAMFTSTSPGTNNYLYLASDKSLKVNDVLDPDKPTIDKYNVGPPAPSYKLDKKKYNLAYIQIFSLAAGGVFNWVRDERIYGSKIQVDPTFTYDKIRALADVTALEETQCNSSDVEGMALVDPDDAGKKKGDGAVLYIVGSGSLGREKLQPSFTPCPLRGMLTTIHLTTAGDISERKTIDPWSIVEAKKNEEKFGLVYKLLEPSRSVPAKENGFDIEGIAATPTRLYLGFRGPVLESKYAPVLVIDREDQHNFELKFLDLGGLGIRDITYAKDVGSFLLIAGPNMEQSGPFILYEWNGGNMANGNGELNQLCKLKKNAEGIFVRSSKLKDGRADYEIILSYDNEDSSNFKIEIGKISSTGEE